MLDNDGVSLLDDVNMEDLSDLAEALVPTAAPHEPDDANDDADAMDDVTQGLPAGGGAADAHNNTHDDTNNTSDLPESTSAKPESAPNHHDRATSSNEAATRRLDMLQRHLAVEDQFRRFGVEARDRQRIVKDVVQPAKASGFRKDAQPCPDQPEVMAFPRPEHHLVIAQPDRAGIAVCRHVAHGQQPGRSHGGAEGQDSRLLIRQVDRLPGKFSENAK